MSWRIRCHRAVPSFIGECPAPSSSISRWARRDHGVARRCLPGFLVLPAGVLPSADPVPRPRTESHRRRLAGRETRAFRRGESRSHARSRRVVSMTALSQDRFPRAAHVVQLSLGRVLPRDQLTRQAQSLVVGTRIGAQGRNPRACGLRNRSTRETRSSGRRSKPSKSFRRWPRHFASRTSRTAGVTPVTSLLM